MNDSNHDVRAMKAQAAIVRTLVDELKRDRHASETGALEAQTVEESARLVSHIEELSRRRSEAPEVEPSRPTRVEAGGRLPRVLLVEDDDIARQAMARWLSEGYEVVTARNGAEGLERASHEPPDVIIADVAMPGMDGIAMVERIRELDSSARVPVIFLTGQSAPESVAAGFRAGGSAYLIKPVELDLLDGELRAAIGFARESR
jgi:CheY-like chemotaxis protein